MGLGEPGLAGRALTLGSRGGGGGGRQGWVLVNRTGLWWGDGKRTQVVGTPGEACRSDVVSSLGKRFRGTGKQARFERCL